MEVVVVLVIGGIVWLAITYSKSQREEAEFEDLMGVSSQEMTDWVRGKRPHLSNDVTEDIMRGAFTPPSSRVAASAAGSSVEQAGEWLIARIGAYAEVSGSPLTPWEEERLRTPLHQLDMPTVADLRLNNRVVYFARHAMDREKGEGAECAEARSGLRVPTSWFEAYGTIYTGKLPWVLSGAMQNAMLANAPDGETELWTSP